MAESINMPTGFGGLTRFKEEYNSKFKFGPSVVVGMIIAVVILVIGLRIFYT